MPDMSFSTRERPDNAAAKDRIARVERATKETTIAVEINLDGSGKSDIQTGVPFFDHMLQAFANHSLIDVSIHADVLKADLPADDGAAAVVAQHIEAAAGNQAHTMAVRPSEKEARAATRLSKPVRSSPAVSSRPASLMVPRQDTSPPT